MSRCPNCRLEHSGEHEEVGALLLCAVCGIPMRIVPGGGRRALSRKEVDALPVWTKQVLAEVQSQTAIPAPLWALV